VLHRFTLVPRDNKVKIKGKNHQNQQHLSKKLSLKISRKGKFKGNSMSKPKKNLGKAHQIKGLGNSGLKNTF
jgi:hypothetical protein